ncbi:MAG: MFS transporter [Actinobacteria bacterium]|nr:MFS transporter [Actinomycetota bacterium]
MRLPYAELASNPRWRRWTMATGLSRVTVAAAPLALVIGGHYATGSWSDGAVLAGVYAFAEALAAPWHGRRLDRAETRAGLTRALAGGGAGLAALLAGLLSRAALPWLIAATIWAAAISAGVQGGLRAWLPELTGAEHAQAAFALDASLLEIEWLSAPALVAIAALLGAPFLGVGAMLAATVAALAALRLLPRRPPAGTAPRGPSPWRSRPARRSYLVSASFGYTEGIITVGLAPLLAALHSRPGYAGLFLVGLSLASAAGGFAFGALGGRVPGSSERQANIILAGLGLLALPVALAGSPWAAAAAVAAFGLLIAPLNGLRTQLLSRAVSPAQRAQAFSIMYAAMGAGFGLAGLAAGILLGPLGIRGVIATAAAAAVLTALTAGLSRDRQEPATVPAARRAGQLY